MLKSDPVFRVVLVRTSGVNVRWNVNMIPLEGVLKSQNLFRGGISQCLFTS